MKPQESLATTVLGEEVSEECRSGMGLKTYRMLGRRMKSRAMDGEIQGDAREDLYIWNGASCVARSLSADKERVLFWFESAMSSVAVALEPAEL